MFEKEDKYFVVVSMILALMFLSLSFYSVGNQNVNLSPPCQAGETFSCPSGYVVAQSSTTGRSEFIAINCPASGEIVPLGILPYRSDNRQVCKSSNVYSPSFYSYKSSSTCQNYAVIQDGSEGDYNQIVEGTCSVSTIYNCEVRDAEGNLIYRANNNERMWVISGTSGYIEKHILCYNNQWWEEGTTNDWNMINDGFDAVDVLACYEKGSWYVDQPNGEWKLGTCSGPPPQPVTGELIGYYNFNEDNVSDVSRWNKDGTPTQISYSNGKSGRAAYFNGSAFIRVNQFDNLLGKSFSITMWLKPSFNSKGIWNDNPPGILNLVNQDGSKFLSVYQNPLNFTALSMNSNNDAYWNYDNYSFNSGDWIFLSAVYNSTSDIARLYVNGKAASQGNGNGYGGITGNSAILFLGKTYNYNYTGVMDEVKIYNKTLTSQEIIASCGDTCVVTTPVINLTNKKIIFVTNSSWIGNFSVDSSGSRPLTISGGSGIARADAICNNDTAKPKSGVTFKALIGTDSRKKSGTDWVLAKNTSYYNVNGELIGKTKNDNWFDFSLFHPIISTEYIVATGLTSQGNKDDNCNNWESGNSTRTASTGESDEASETVIENENKQCNTDMRIYCVEWTPIGIDEDCLNGPNWQPGNWSRNVSGIECGIRTVTDTNNCGVDTNKPETTKTCPTENVCGNDICETGETPTSCAIDCEEEPHIDSVCGDDTLDDDEQCDDGNIVNGDGCSSTCLREKDKKNNMWIYVLVIGIIILLVLILIVLMIKKMNRKKDDKHSGVSLSTIKKSPPRNGSERERYSQRIISGGPTGVNSITNTPKRINISPSRGQVNSDIPSPPNDAKVNLRK